MDPGALIRAVTFCLYGSDRVSEAHAQLRRREIGPYLGADYAATFDDALVRRAVRLLWPHCFLPWFAPRCAARLPVVRRVLAWSVSLGLASSRFHRMDARYYAAGHRGEASVDMIMHTCDVLVSRAPTANVPVPLVPRRTRTAHYGARDVGVEITTQELECLLDYGLWVSLSSDEDAASCVFDDDGGGGV